jgi:hypothetical protein
MVGLFYIYLPMSFNIPAQIEQDIICGKATYRTFQTGAGGQSILDISPNSYVVIFGYDFSPAGGGIYESQNFTASPALASDNIRFFETQQISFYTGSDFFPFIHHVNIEANETVIGVAQDVFRILNSVDNTPISRQVYITSSSPVSITVGLVNICTRVVANAIPITNRTPPTLTYGGSAQVINTQTDFGPAATPLQFVQPSPISYQDFGFGALPGNADAQAFATPDPTNGLVDPSFYLRTVYGATFNDKAACNYFLNVHYALYTAAIPETRG